MREDRQEDQCIDAEGKKIIEKYTDRNNGGRRAIVIIVMVKYI